MLELRIRETSRGPPGGEGYRRELGEIRAVRITIAMSGVLLV